MNAPNEDRYISTGIGECDAFMFWYRDNSKQLNEDREAEEIKTIVESFDFEDFKIEEILSSLQ